MFSLCLCACVFICLFCLYEVLYFINKKNVVAVVVIVVLMLLMLLLLDEENETAHL